MKNSSPHRVLTIVGIGVALSLLGDNTLYTVLPDPRIAAQAGVSLTMVGVLLGINRLSRVVFNSMAGTLYDRLPRRGLMIAAICIGAISTLSYAIARDVELLIIGRILWGLAWSGIWVGANTVVLDISQSGNRGRNSGRLQMWFFLGGAVSALAGGFFTDALGYRQGLLLSAAITFLMVFLWLIFLPETRPGYRKIPAENTRASQADPDSEAPLDSQARSQSQPSFPWRATLEASVPYFALRFVYAGVMTATTILWLSQFVGEGLSLGGVAVPLATLTGGFVSLRVLVSMLGAPIAGSISDRLGSRWAVLLGALVMGAVGLWLMSLVWVIPAVLGAFFATIAAGGIQGVVPASVGDRVGDRHQSRALGVVFTVGDISSALGPAVGLWTVTSLGLAGVYRMSALVFVLAGLLAARSAFRERRTYSAARAA